MKGEESRREMVEENGKKGTIKRRMKHRDRMRRRNQNKTKNGSKFRKRRMK